MLFSEYKGKTAKNLLKTIIYRFFAKQKFNSLSLSDLRITQYIKYEVRKEIANYSNDKHYFNEKAIIAA